MLDRREKNAVIFKDTEYMYRTNNELMTAVEQSKYKQKLILEDDIIDLVVEKSKLGKVMVSGKRTLEASELYAKQGKKVCVLNFASATNPGGGVVYGSSAQEESICRCSTLYPCLDSKNMWEQFYVPHRRAENPLYNNDCIYTPEVKVFKKDTDFPELLDKNDWWNVDVITCAAPNLRNVSISINELREVLISRINRIFDVAISNGADVLILGAFGCGAFRNPARLVADVFAEFTDEYRKCFDVIEYAVFHTKQEKVNFDAFKARIGRDNV
jgi:uncharacterized protein (TIGR02452 family)